MNARIIIGSAPDSWGVWFADDPEQTTADPIARAPACPHAVKRQATP